MSITNPEEMSITIKPDTANLNGVYIVRWITVSALDGDPDQGAFFFTVKTGAVATPIPATSTGHTNPPATTSGTPLWVPIVASVLALLVGLGGGLAGGRALGQRRPATAVSSMRKEVAQQQQKEEEKIKNP